MKLAIVGISICGLGVALGVPGLAASGGPWIGAGLLALAFAARWAERERPGALAPEPLGGGFARTTAVLLTIGIPSLAIGLLEIGFSQADSEWRWIPIAAGALSCGIAAAGLVLNLVASRLVAAGEPGEGAQLPATVTIGSMRETGAFVNGRPRVEFRLLVQPAGSPPYELTKRATVPLTALGSVRVGGGFRARLKRGRPKAVAIDWDSPISPTE